jgi:transposase
MRSQPDATLVELQAELESKTGLRVSTQHLWRVIKRLARISHRRRDDQEFKG